MRPIDADGLKKSIEEDEELKGNSLAYLLMNLMTCYIDESPTVDAESARHGLWIDRHVTDFGVAEEFCGRCEEWSVGWHKRYCPNCGAKMDGKVNNNERD